MKLKETCFHLHFPRKIHWLTYILVFQYERYFWPIKDDTWFTFDFNVVQNNDNYDERKILFGVGSNNERELNYKDGNFIQLKRVCRVGNSSKSLSAKGNMITSIVFS